MKPGTVRADQEGRDSTGLQGSWCAFQGIQLVALDIHLAQIHMSFDPLHQTVQRRSPDLQDAPGLPACRVGTPLDTATVSILEKARAAG
jgi:hypothetical protein